VTPDQWLSRVAQAPDLSATQRAVALSLWSFMDKQGLCWPSVESIGARAGIRKRDHVRAALKVLEEVGYLTRKVQPGGRYSTNSYRAADPSRPPRKGVTPVTPLRDSRPPRKGVTYGAPQRGHELSQEELTRARGGTASDGPHPFIAALSSSKALR
jgi:hypothetical protein